MSVQVDLRFEKDCAVVGRRRFLRRLLKLRRRAVCFGFRRVRLVRLADLVRNGGEVLFKFRFDFRVSESRRRFQLDRGTVFGVVETFVGKARLFDNLRVLGLFGVVCGVVILRFVVYRLRFRFQFRNRIVFFDGPDFLNVVYRRVDRSFIEPAVFAQFVRLHCQIFKFPAKNVRLARNAFPYVREREFFTGVVAAVGHDGKNDRFRPLAFGHSGQLFTEGVDCVTNSVVHCACALILNGDRGVQGVVRYLVEVKFVDNLFATVGEFIDVEAFFPLHSVAQSA